MSITRLVYLLLVVVLADPFTTELARGEEAANEVYPIAILPFQERGREAVDLGAQVTDLLFANLVADPEMYLVEREDISKILEESELNLTGLVSPDQAVRVGQLSGARIIVTGSVVIAGDSQILVAKIIGTETSRVLGVSVKGKVGDDLDGMAEQLAKRISETVTKKASELVAEKKTKEDRLLQLKKKLGDDARPSVWISVEERHVGQATIDPAAETELALICRDLGFRVIDHETGKKTDADVLLTGEGFSQFAARRGNLVSVKARLEVKAVKRDSGDVIAIDRQVAVALDLAEQVAGKSALQDAAAIIAERILPKLVGRK